MAAIHPTPAFRREVVTHALANGHRATAKRYTISLATISAWRHTYEHDELATMANAAQRDAGGDGPAQPAPPADDDVPTGHPLVEFLDKRTGRVDLDGAYDAIEAMQSLIETASSGQSECRVRIATDEPVVVWFHSDQHIGSGAVDYATLRRDQRLLLETPHVYLAVCGDEIDNFHGFRAISAILGQVVPPKFQKQMLIEYYRRLVAAAKVLWRTHGNHGEDFDDRVFGGALDAYNELLPFLRDDGRVTLEVGDQEYLIHAQHKFKGQSMYNRTHGAMRSARFAWQDAEVLVDGHTHDGPAIHQDHLNGRPRVYIKLGTYKTNDVYSKRHFGLSEAVFPCVVFFADRHHIVPFERVEDAITYRAAAARAIRDGRASSV